MDSPATPSRRRPRRNRAPKPAPWRRPAAIAAVSVTVAAGAGLLLWRYCYGLAKSEVLTMAMTPDICADLLAWTASQHPSLEDALRTQRATHRFSIVRDRSADDAHVRVIVRVPDVAGARLFSAKLDIRHPWRGLREIDRTDFEFFELAKVRRTVMGSSPCNIYPGCKIPEEGFAAAARALARGDAVPDLSDRSIGAAAQMWPAASDPWRGLAPEPRPALSIGGVEEVTAP